MKNYRVDVQLSVVLRAKSAKEANRILTESGVEITGENSSRFSDCWLDGWKLFDQNDTPIKAR